MLLASLFLRLSVSFVIVRSHNLMQGYLCYFELSKLFSFSLAWILTVSDSSSQNQTWERTDDNEGYVSRYLLNNVLFFKLFLSNVYNNNDRKHLCRIVLCTTHI